MTFDEYEQGTGNTWRTDQPDLPGELANALLGLGGEVGELQDAIKKHHFHGVSTTLDAIKKELGDAQYYLTRVAKYYGLTLEEVCQGNYDKLKARYPQGFVLGGGVR